MSSKKHKTPVIRFKGFTDAWEQRKLIEMANFRRGSFPQPYGEKKWYDDTNGMPFVQVVDVGNNLRLVNNTKQKISELAQPKSVFVEAGKVVVTLQGSIGRVAITQYPSYVDRTLLIFESYKRPIDEYYFAYVIQQLFEIEKRTAPGGTIKTITKEVLSDFLINIPEFNEQQTLGNFFKQLDDTIALHQRQLGNYKELKKAMLQKMFPRDGESVPEVRFAGFTESWEQRKFKELFCERREKTVFENEDTLLSCAIEGMFLNTELFSHFRGSSNIGYLKVKKNDLILSAQNLHIGNANVNLRFEHGIISPAYKVYDLINSNPLFIQAWVKKDATKNFFLSATTEGASGCRKNVEWKVLNEQVIAVPNMEEQNKIGEFFKQLDETIALHQQKGTDYQQLKKTMLQQMFV